LIPHLPSGVRPNYLPTRESARLEPVLRRPTGAEGEVYAGPMLLSNQVLAALRHLPISM